MPNNLIFLSYTHNDSAAMKYVKQVLQADEFIQRNGYEIWTDEKTTGNIIQSVSDALERSACFIILLSPNSKHSRWQSGELLSAIENRIPVIPILLDIEHRDIPPVIKAERSVKLTQQVGKFEELLRQVQHHLQDSGEIKSLSPEKILPIELPADSNGFIPMPLDILTNPVKLDSYSSVDLYRWGSAWVSIFCAVAVIGPVVAYLMGFITTTAITTTPLIVVLGLLIDLFICGIGFIPFGISKERWNKLWLGILLFSLIASAIGYHLVASYGTVVFTTGQGARSAAIMAATSIWIGAACALAYYQFNWSSLSIPIGFSIGFFIFTFTNGFQFNRDGAQALISGIIFFTVAFVIYKGLQVNTARRKRTLWGWLALITLFVGAAFNLFVYITWTSQIWDVM